MMSRLNWMTYLKVLFDKLLQQNHEMQVAGKQTFLMVDAGQLLQALVKIKGHLPLLQRDQYMQRHQCERGFSVKDIEMSLRRFIMSRKAESMVLDVSWDDCIDLFIQSHITGEQSSFMHTGSGKGSSKKGLGGSTVNYQTLQPVSQPTMNSHSKQMKLHITTDHEDLVNVSDGNSRHNFEALLQKEAEASY